MSETCSTLDEVLEAIRAAAKNSAGEPTGSSRVLLSELARLLEERAAFRAEWQDYEPPEPDDGAWEAEMKPWEDTVMCSCGGPLVPADDATPPTTAHARCAACGEHRDAESLTAEEIARIFWSAGVWEGRR